MQRHRAFAVVPRFNQRAEIKFGAANERCADGDVHRQIRRFRLAQLSFGVFKRIAQVACKEHSDPAAVQVDPYAGSSLSALALGGAVEGRLSCRRR